MKIRNLYQQGITLLESLIAIIVIALGVLGILGMQMRTLNNTQNSLYRTQAIRLIDDLSERIAANPNALLNTEEYITTNWGNNQEFSQNCKTEKCSNENLAKYDLLQWRNSVKNSLPLGDARTFISDDEASVADNKRQLGVMIAWRMNENNNSQEYLDPLNAATGSGNTVSCPDNHTCHLQYIPLLARCAPYYASNTTKVFCPGS